MNYEITNLTEEDVEVKDLELVINAVTKILDCKDTLVSVVLVNNDKIHEINKTYRGVDKETDVISFAFMDEGTNPNKDITNLGEIYISLEKAHSQSEEYNHSFKRELCFLLTHGLLHLLGYDHMDDEDEKEMFDLQEEILNSINIVR